MDYAILLLVVGCIAVGVAAAVVRTWSLHARTYSLEDRVACLEGVTTREVKIRAAQARYAKPDKDAELLAALQPKETVPATRYNWWQINAPRSVSQKS